MYRWFVYSMLWACSKFPCAWREGSLHSLFGFDLFASFLALENFPGAWPTHFLSSSFTGSTRDPQFDEEVSSLYWLRITTFTGLAFAVGEPSFEVVFCPRFDMAPITMRSLSFERKLFKWLQEYIENFKKLNTECQRVGFWCQHVWFGFWVPNGFCQITHQEQLCGFWTHVSSSDFVL